MASFKNNILAGTLTNFNSTGGLTTNSVTSIDSSAWGTFTGPLIQLKANANLRYVTDNNALYNQLPRNQLV